jgi:lathosterol oxidase|tara:strand:- start:15183 stop:15950 length:768 start_codon:yes stop_codon:yes gene_type:complete
MQLQPIELFERLVFFNFFRYALIAAIFFFIWYVVFRKKWSFKKIQNDFPKNSDYKREIGYSLFTVVLFSVVAYIMLTEPVSNYTLRYFEFSDRSTAYWWFSLFLMIILHDTYFYWTHRLMHHKKLFKLVHLVHHKSTNPSPWAAYAFHPLEGIIESAVIFPIILLIPHHITAIIAFMFFMMIYNVYGHLGYEVYPKGFGKTWFGKWINTSVNHNQHHKHVKGNYGLYFLFWDRWMGTIREDYDDEIELVDEKRFS